MELQTVRQVSLEYGISARMLRYYEQIGILESLRTDDYAYRVYDEAGIKRLQQIIILRKLQIPVKQIKDIITNQDAVAVVEVFKQNITELDERITALSAVKSILTRFVDEMQKKADVHLKLDILNDKTMLAVVNSLSFSENKIHEKVSLEELNQANKQLSKQAEQTVRIVYRPPATMASIRHNGGDTVSDAKAKKDSEAVIQKFIKDTDLLKLKPDIRVFGFGHGNGYGGWEMWVTIPDDLDVPPHLKKIIFNGGLYAVSPAGFDLSQWVQESDVYDWEPHSPGGDEYINPFNIYGLKNIYSETGGSMYFEHSIPVKEIEKLTQTQIKQIDAALTKIEKNRRGEPIEIDLAVMVKNGEFDLKYTDGLMEIRAEGRYDGAQMVTPRQFDLPLKIEMRAKTNNTDINLEYAKGWICYNHHQTRNKWFIMDFLNGSVSSYKLPRKAAVNEFVDVEWFIGREMMVVKVNGEIQHVGSDYEYVRAFNKNPDYILSSAVTISTTGGSTLTVESLRITEIQ